MLFLTLHFCVPNLKMAFLEKLSKIAKRAICHRQINTRYCLRCEETLSERLRDLLTSESEYNKLAEAYFRIGEAHKCLIIQPYVKWGPKKLNISPEEQLSEAIALIHTLPAWTVEETVTVPLDTLDRKTLFKSGSMDKLKNIIRNGKSVSAVFVNTSNLKKSTSTILQENFGKPVLDRYKIVMQILKTHATSKHAKLQVALAELHYLRRKSEKDLIFKTYNPEVLKLVFQEREQKLKSEINNLRGQRNLLRNQRRKLEYPVVAVVGYTNAGKTSIIKALTGEKSLQPKDQLFATLDVTVHSGALPSGLDVLYVDTVGFISDIPTNLIECFVATLEDALLADAIIHVEDVSSSSYEYKRKHVLDTLKELGYQTETKDIQNKIISIGNKCDLVDLDSCKEIDILPVSAEKGIGLDVLKEQLERFILKVTARQRITIRIPNGGDEIRWLYKNSTVLSEIPDEKDCEFVFARIIITQANLGKFKHQFVLEKRNKL